MSSVVDGDEPSNPIEASSPPRGEPRPLSMAALAATPPKRSLPLPTAHATPDAVGWLVYGARPKIIQTVIQCI